MLSITLKFNVSATHFNTSWLAIMSLWILISIEAEAKAEKRIMEQTTQKHNVSSKPIRPAPS